MLGSLKALFKFGGKTSFETGNPEAKMVKRNEIEKSPKNTRKISSFFFIEFDLQFQYNMAGKKKTTKVRLVLTRLLKGSLMLLICTLLFQKLNQKRTKTQPTQVRSVVPQSVIATPTPSTIPKKSLPAINDRPSSFISKITTLNDAPSPIPTKVDNRKWGIAEQLSEHEWTITVLSDERMGTPEEIFEALNVYRERHGSGKLTRDDKLAEFAQTRADQFVKDRSLDSHAGFREFLSNQDNYASLGFWSVGENSCYGTRLVGVHIIEWIFAGDEPHDKNQLNPGWSHVGIGVKTTAVDVVFGKGKR